MNTTEPAFIFNPVVFFVYPVVSCVVYTKPLETVS